MTSSVPKTFNRAVFKEQGANLTLEEVELVLHRRGEILVKVEACGGLPGAGNVLLFDNQGGAGYPPASLGIYAGSRILDIDPPTKHFIWQYTAEDSGLPPWTFFSSFVSNAQRLPNGNTLITEGMQGCIFQVTPEGRVAWEYYSQYTGYGVTGEPEVSKPQVPGVDRLSMTPLVYRSQAVPDEWLPDGMKRAAAVAVDSS